MMQNRIEEIFWGQTFKNIFLFQFQGPRFLEAPDLWVRCSRLYFFRKRAPIFLEAPDLWVRRSKLFLPQDKTFFWKPCPCGYDAQGCFFLEKWPQSFWSPQLVGTLLKAAFFQKKGGSKCSPSATRVGLVCELTIVGYCKWVQSGQIPFEHSRKSAMCSR